MGAKSMASSSSSSSLSPPLSQEEGRKERRREEKKERKRHGSPFPNTYSILSQQLSFPRKLYLYRNLRSSFPPVELVNFAIPPSYSGSRTRTDFVQRPAALTTYRYQHIVIEKNLSKVFHICIQRFHPDKCHCIGMYSINGRDPTPKRNLVKE